MTGAVLKTVVAGHPGKAGSIPVRLRHAKERARSDPRRRTPRTDTVLDAPEVRAACTASRAGTGQGDRRRGAGGLPPGTGRPGRRPARRLASLPPTATSLRRVLNATGVVVHTNLGRAPLSAAALEALTSRPAPPTSSSTSPQAGVGPGAAALAALAAAVPDAGGVHVVNNGAAALALVACAPGAGPRDRRGAGRAGRDRRRLPDPGAAGAVGARLREVGTTNRVQLDDYRARSATGRRSCSRCTRRTSGSRASPRVGRRRGAGHARRAGRGRHRLRPAGTPSAAAGRARRGELPPRRRRARDRIRRQAARRAAVRAGARRRRPRRSGCGDTRSPAPCASTS